MLLGLTGVALSGAVFAVSAAQARGTFTAEPLQPKFSRINPISNAQRLFGWRPVAELVKSVLKVLIVGFITWRVLGAAWPELLDLGGRGTPSVLATIRGTLVRLLAVTGGVYLTLAAADYAFQYWQHVRGMRMTKDEVRQETKQQDGDQLVKSRIRAVARARIRRQMFADVPTADVVIVNPTQRAIALRYDPVAAPAPVVLAMGERKVAERIKQIAREHGVPMIENRPLARALLATARVGTTIPAELYAAVAEVLAFVYRQRALRGEPAEWTRTVSS
jgi:flagellar biosynthetic protein FlhB